MFELFLVVYLLLVVCIPFYSFLLLFVSFFCSFLIPFFVPFYYSSPARAVAWRQHSTAQDRAVTLQQKRHTTTHQPLSTTVNHHQPPPSTANHCQPLPTKGAYCKHTRVEQPNQPTNNRHTAHCSKLITTYHCSVDCSFVLLNSLCTRGRRSAVYVSAALVPRDHGPASA